MNLDTYLEEKINYYANMIVDHSTRADEVALGHLTFYMSLRRAVNGKASMQDVGLLDAINDLLQAKGLVGAEETFYK
jgi:hypothetical protein